MPIVENHIQVIKTARYFTLGNPSEKIEQVWFVCHGYGMLAAPFLKNFDVLDDGKTLVVAPEGLHRFYWNGFDGKVVASWMTREDRFYDIKDYVNFLDQVYDEVMKQFSGRTLKVSVLGFSQGVATVSRWVCMGKSKAHQLVLWAGMFPPDLNFEPDQNIFNKMNTIIVIGDKDEFVKNGQVEEHEKQLMQLGIKYKLIRFDGRHEIVPEVLRMIANEPG